MSGRDHAMKVARIYLENEYRSDIIRAEGKLRMYWVEYQRRLKNIEHYEGENKIIARKGIEDALSKEFNILIESCENTPSLSEDNKTIQNRTIVKFGMNTKYIFVSYLDGKDIGTELNGNATKLIGLIYAIIKG